MELVEAVTEQEETYTLYTYYKELLDKWANNLIRSRKMEMWMWMWMWIEDGDGDGKGKEEEEEEKEKSKEVF